MVVAVKPGKLPSPPPRAGPTPSHLQLLRNSSALTHTSGTIPKGPKATECHRDKCVSTWPCNQYTQYSRHLCTFITQMRYTCVCVMLAGTQARTLSFPDGEVGHRIVLLVRASLIVRKEL